jgi:GNAT superfamily N-acetyltransferase
MAEYDSGDGRWLVRPTSLPTLNFHQFSPHINFSKAGEYSNHGINVHHLSIDSHHEGGEEMGHIEWHKDRGEILRVHVEKPYRRLGVAQTLFHEAKTIARNQGLTEPVHSADRSDMGNKWAKAVGGVLPKRLKNSDRASE